MTIKDIARESGFAIGTVSRALNNAPGVSAETRQKILEVVNRHNYEPNANAKHLKQQANDGIALIVKGTQNMLFADILEQLQSVIEESGYVATVYYIDEEANEVAQARRICAERKPYGILFLGSNLEYFTPDLEDLGIPCLLLTNSAATLRIANLSSVSVDDMAASDRMIEYLYKQGHRRIGIIGGLIGGLLCIEFGMSGFTGLFFAIAVGLVIAAATGWLYGLLLNRLKGSEMSVTTYVGFSVVSLMCIAWLVLPFKSPIMKWPLGNGLRTTIGLQTSYRHVLNDFLSFEIFGVTIPTGLLLFFAACCLVVWLFMRSKTGIAMSAAGANPRFAAATGINVDRMRIIGTMLSTMLAAVGIIVYGQSYGFMQLYQAPRQMGFLAASAILIGGATTSRAKISNVVIGTFLFQGVLTLGMPVANALVPQSTISETLRILISNGIILYALTKSGGANRG